MARFAEILKNLAGIWSAIQSFKVSFPWWVVPHHRYVK